MIKRLLKIKKIGLIALLGAVLFSLSPFTGYSYSPYVTTGTATAITSNSVTFNGSVNADNMPTSVWFEYGTDASLRGSSSVSAYRFTSGNSGNIVANVSGLYPHTTYYFRAVAQNSDGRAYGNIYLFTTNFETLTYDSYATINPPLPLNTISTPTITTNPATSVSTRSAKLNSLAINSFANPASTITWFEWGATPYLGDVTPAISLGSLSSAKHVNTITGLSPSTTYYFRAIMQNGASRVDGTTLSFTTGYAAAPTPAPSLVAEKANEPEPEPEPEPAVTNTSTVEPAEDEDQDSSLAASSALTESDSFLPNNVFEWIILVILVLVLLIMSKYLYLSFSAKPTHPAGGH